MLKPYEIDAAFRNVPREKQEIRFQISPFPRNYFLFEKSGCSDIYIANFYIAAMDNIGDIEPSIIAGRHIEMEYLAGSERRAKYLAQLIKSAGPLSAFYTTPRGDYVMFEHGRWVCKIKNTSQGFVKL